MPSQTEGTRMHRALPGVVLVVLLALATAACSASATDRTGKAGPPAAKSSGSAQVLQAEGYVALGDSYSSAPLVPVTDVANGCFRSSHNYPALVAQELRIKVDDRTCGGATTDSLRQPQRSGIPPQLDALTTRTQLVTVGIGGNDAGVFSELTRRCPSLRSRKPQGAPCQRYMTRGGKDRLLTALRATTGRVRSVLDEVHRRSPDAKVLVVGYPHIVEADHRCAQLPLATGDYAYGERVNRALVEAVRRAAVASRSTYIDVWKASQGHDICSDDPWINGSVNDQQKAASYHPFASEQQAVARLVLDAVRG